MGHEEWLFCTCVCLITGVSTDATLLYQCFAILPVLQDVCKAALNGRHLPTRRPQQGQSFSENLLLLFEPPSATQTH